MEPEESPVRLLRGDLSQRQNTSEPHILHAVPVLCRHPLGTRNASSERRTRDRSMRSGGSGIPREPPPSDDPPRTTKSRSIARGGFGAFDGTRQTGTDVPIDGPDPSSTFCPYLLPDGSVGSGKRAPGSCHADARETRYRRESGLEDVLGSPRGTRLRVPDQDALARVSAISSAIKWWRDQYQEVSERCRHCLCKAGIESAGTPRVVRAERPRERKVGLGMGLRDTGRAERVSEFPSNWYP